jgi:hypothetical protein
MVLVHHHRACSGYLAKYGGCGTVVTWRRTVLSVHDLASPKARENMVVRYLASIGWLICRLIWIWWILGEGEGRGPGSINWRGVDFL